MKKYLVIPTLLLVTLAFLLVPKLYQQTQNPEPTTTTTPLPQLVKTAIDKSHSKISPVRREMLSHSLSYIANQVFENQQHKEYWIVLIGAESAYDGAAKSNKGAIGLGQLIPRFREDFAKTCQLNGVTETDIQDDFTNAFLSACQFRKLIADNNGNIPLALISYNAGPNSEDRKRAKNGSSVSHEPAAYTTRILVNAQEYK